MVLGLVVASAASVWAQPGRSAREKRASLLYGACTTFPEGEPDEVGCRKAFDYVRQAARAEPRSLELSVIFASLELRYGLPNAEADAEKRLRAAIRARPDWEAPYLAIIGLASTSPLERRSLLHEIIRRDPKANQAIYELIMLLSVEPEIPPEDAAEIVSLFSQYHALMGLENSPFEFEMERFSVGSLMEAGRVKEAAAVLNPIVELGLQGDSPSWVCITLVNEHLDDYSSVPDFHARLLQLRRYCTERDHEDASLKHKVAGRLREASEELELQIRTNPYYLHAYPDLSTLYLQLERKDDAVRVLQKFWSGDWTKQAKCGLLSEFGDLSRYPLSAEFQPERIAAECKKAK